MIKTDKHLYEVCSLFFAIAISDVRFHEIEKEMVIKAISDYRKNLPEQNSLHPSTEFEEHMLKTVSEEEANAWQLFDKFEKYYTENEAEFNDSSKQLIIAKANEIASSYARQNKSEIVLIARLRLLFNKT